jgi:transcriptional regulator with XRE-family HTH domain
MTNIGEKIRSIRTLKGFSQENLAEMLNLSLPAYADIERGKKDVNFKRLEQIANKLGVTLNDILTFEDKVSNFFDRCSNSNVSTGNGSNTVNHYDTKEIQHKLEKAFLEIEKLNIKLEKAEFEVKYWREKCEK